MSEELKFNSIGPEDILTQNPSLMKVNFWLYSSISDCIDSGLHACRIFVRGKKIPFKSNILTNSDHNDMVKISDFE